MSGKSSKTTLISLRIPNEMLEAIDKRLKGQLNPDDNRNKLILRILGNDIGRKR